jgi:hypothetical protein
MAIKIELCSCPLAGFCHRHNRIKDGLEHALCLARTQESMVYRFRLDTGKDLWEELQQDSPPQPAGLGDLISSAMELVGISEERVTAWLGKPCGCKERREKLNRLGRWATRILSRKEKSPSPPPAQPM